MKHIKRIDEFIVSKPYDWEWLVDSGLERIATFSNEEDTYWVYFVHKDPFEPWIMSFKSQKLEYGGTEFRSPSLAMKVLHTVFAEIMVAFLELNDDAVVQFVGAEGFKDAHAGGPIKRDRIYKMMMDGLPESMHWKLGNDGKTIYVANVDVELP